MHALSQEIRAEKKEPKQKAERERHGVCGVFSSVVYVHYVGVLACVHSGVHVPRGNVLMCVHTGVYVHRGGLGGLLLLYQGLLDSGRRRLSEIA